VIDFSELRKGDFLEHIDKNNFEDIAIAVFQYQYNHNDIYRQFTDALGVSPSVIKRAHQIPFLPVSFFKTHKVTAGAGLQAMVFESSGTTGVIPSRHYIHDAAIYEQALLQGFRQFYGNPKDYAIMALLPSYLERETSSLVHMAKMLMDKSHHAANGFYLNEFEQLQHTLQMLETRGQKTLLLGVTFALLDFAAAYPMPLANTIVMETGGMKGRREEWTRQQVHEFLKEQWQLQQVHSEYGMTELLSQAYAKKDGIFETTETMSVLVRDINDPLEIKHTGIGCLNIIDLANIHSCSFIATDDIGSIASDGTFEVLGRADNAVLRGCNLMVI
jgi:phenylacetate-coenzyme A ligase PaaK-like adenylate-forming protein